ncbi:feruloyl esterase [Annulohypoxylon stygium]|nr:feruloyl esterase [Annulohypoxylon stygium]
MFSAWAALGLQALANPWSQSSTQQTCDSFVLPAFENFTIVSLETHLVTNYSLVPNVSFCNFTAILNHPGTNDTVITEIWLPPLQKWNGRFLATGGGGLAAGYEWSMAAYIYLGYATGFTDGGLTNLNIIDPQLGTWVLNDDDTLNWGLLKNFAYRSLHDMTVLGKAAIYSFYGEASQYSYYVGCSTGGRMGYFAAQHFPNDYDGILAMSPAINTPQLGPADFWPMVAMENIDAPPQCVFDVYLKQMIADCDSLDGAMDGLISRPEICNFNPRKLIGRTIKCSVTGSNVEISTEYADVVSKIIEGARTTDGQFLWFGLPIGASFSGLANTTVVDGRVTPVPFTSAQAWIEYFIRRNSSFDMAEEATSSFIQFEQDFRKSVELYTPMFGTEKPNLSPFHDAGGKLLTWHGMADPVITHNGTTLYWDRVQQQFEGSHLINDFYRLFLAPGVGHCSGGYGPIPMDPLSALVGWVENHKAPDTLFAEITVDNINITRNLCPYPLIMTYNGLGNVNSADSFTCTSS